MKGDKQMKPPKIFDNKLNDIMLEIKDSFDYLEDEVQYFKEEATGENRKFVNEDIDILRKELSALRSLINDLYIPRNLTKRD